MSSFGPFLLKRLATFVATLAVATLVVFAVLEVLSAVQDWPEHEEKITRIWASAILFEGFYNGASGGREYPTGAF